MRHSPSQIAREVVTFGGLTTGRRVLQRWEDRNDLVIGSVLGSRETEGIMRTSLAVASIGLALVLPACGSPGGTVPTSGMPSAPAPGSPSPAVAECSPSHPMPSGEIVKLYFPCGASTNLLPVERSITSDGEEAIGEVVRLFLAGPNAQERHLGFSSLLSPGDIEIVEIHDGRLVLNFPAEVNNVSTSAGSRAVFHGLSLTLLGLEGLSEIELRLRGDCAAFFEWIQVGPECRILTGAGLVPGPTPTPSPAAGIPIIPTQPTGPEITTGSPVSAEDSDGSFRLTLDVGQDRYRAGQVIDVAATLSYLGPAPTVVARGPGSGLVGFGVNSTEPEILIGSASTTDCAPWPFTRDEVVEYPFLKSGGYAEDDPLAPFYRAYFDTPELRLPAGTWTIGAGTGFYSGDDCGEAFPYHGLTVSVTVIVEP